MFRPYFHVKAWFTFTVQCGWTICPHPCPFSLRAYHDPQLNRILMRYSLRRAASPRVRAGLRPAYIMCVGCVVAAKPPQHTQHTFVAGARGSRCPPHLGVVYSPEGEGAGGLTRAGFLDESHQDALCPLSPGRGGGGVTHVTHPSVNGTVQRVSLKPCLRLMSTNVGQI